jgi:hypothetical protein
MKFTYMIHIPNAVKHDAISGALYLRNINEQKVYDLILNYRQLP